MASKSRRAPQDQERVPPTPAPPGGSSDPETETEGSLDDRLDEALVESFPASDPPAVHRLGRGDSHLP
jgi:hypothetical protein